MTERVGVVGGGIVGLAVAREVVRRRPGTRVVVLEKEQRLAGHQTGHNSGVVHAGIYYAPGSLKADLCTRGRELLRDHCVERGLPYDEVGKVVVATDPIELARLAELERRASANGVPGLRRLDARALRDLEPHVVGLAALHSPRTAITDFVAVADSFADEIGAAGGEVRTGHEVTGIRRRGDGVALRCRVVGRDEPEHLEVDRLVVCAGLQADRVSRLVDGSTAPRIVPFRGEYLLLRPERHHLVRGLVYPVPDPRHPFLGVHLTRRVDGTVDVGPNAVLALAREGYRGRPLGVRARARAARDLADTLVWPGFWRLAAEHWRTGAAEVRGAASVSAYLRGAQRYVPELTRADVVRGGSGVRAQAVDRDGSLVDDFRITGDDRVVCLRNAPSPAATSSLAIAEHVVDRLAFGD